MVTFTCSSCGDSVRKNAVERHAFKCRFNVLTCIDCFKEFTRSSFVSHNQCMTENERYQGKLYAGKTSENKGQKKQDDWVQNIQDYVAAGKAGHAAGLVHKLLAYPNIPRKKNKFFNFVSNCMAVRRPEDVERVWTVIVEANQRNDRQEGESKMKQQSNGTKRLIPEDEVVGEPAADKKRIRKGVGGENENGSTVQSDLPNRVVCEQSNFNDSNTVHRGDVSASCQDEKNDSAHTGEQKFSWKKTIKRLVREHEEQSLHLKDLKRQAYALYKDSTSKGSRITKEEAYQNVLKYASRSESLQIRDDVVSLTASPAS